MKKPTRLRYWWYKLTTKKPLSYRVWHTKQLSDILWHDWNYGNEGLLTVGDIEEIKKLYDAQPTKTITLDPEDYY